MACSELGGWPRGLGVEEDGWVWAWARGGDEVIVKPPGLGMLAVGGG